jgi:heterodisulfide reductase subunit A
MCKIPGFEKMPKQAFCKAEKLLLTGIIAQNFIDKIPNYRYQKDLICNFISEIVKRYRKIFLFLILIQTLCLLEKIMTQETIGSVLVVGGGISGMQTALDLADSGYYVYLLEKSPSIGGVMSQLDKTFPTNDCAM